MQEWNAFIVSYEEILARVETFPFFISKFAGKYSRYNRLPVLYLAINHSNQNECSTLDDVFVVYLLDYLESLEPMCFYYNDITMQFWLFSSIRTNWNPITLTTSITSTTTYIATFIASPQTTTQNRYKCDLLAGRQYSLARSIQSNILACCSAVHLQIACVYSCMQYYAAHFRDDCAAIRW